MYGGDRRYEKTRPRSTHKTSERHNILIIVIEKRSNVCSDKSSELAERVPKMFRSNVPQFTFSKKQCDYQTCWNEELVYQYRHGALPSMFFM